MHVIVDLDDTLLVAGDLHPRYQEFREWVCRGKHSVLIWSSHEDGQAFARLMGYEYLAKDAPEAPSGDILIDDAAEQFTKLCFVREAYNSLDSFLACYKDI